jgi:two-component system cell cycle response regulator
MRRLDVRLVWSAAVGAAWLAFYATWLAVAPGGDRGVTIFSNTGYQVPVAAAAALAVVAWLRSPPGLRAFWALLAVSNVLWLATELLWAVRELSTGSVPFPWWTDVGYLTSYAIVPFALFAGLKPTLRTLSAATLLEAGLVTGSLALVWWEVVLRPLPLGLDEASVVGLAYPLLGLLMLGMVFAVRLLPARRGHLPLRLVAGGIACTALADALYTHAAVTHSYLPGAWIALGWQAEAVLFAIAAWLSIGRPRSERSWRRSREPRARTGAAVGLTLVALVAALSHGASTSRATAPLVAAAAVLAVLLGARIWLLLGRGDVASTWDPHQHLRLLAARARHFADPFAVVVAALDSPADEPWPGVETMLRESARPVDSVLRLGDGRWAVLLGSVEAEVAAGVAESIRATAAGQGVTLSLGVALWSAGDDEPEATLARAEQAATHAALLFGNQVRTEADSRVLENSESEAGKLELLLSLAEAVDEREGMTSRHSDSVAGVARDLARELRLSGDLVSSVFLAGLVHDVGKVGIADSVLARPGPLTEKEWAEMRQHPARGAELVRRLAEGEAGALVETHHERWDGRGYPRGLAGERIPLGGRVLAVANALVSMTTDRPFRPAMSVTAALTELWRGSGSRYDPEVVSALLALGREGRLAMDAAEPGAQLRVPL